MKKTAKLFSALLAVWMAASCLPLTAFSASVPFSGPKVAADGNLVGDADADGKVTGKDRLILTRYLAGWAGYGSRVRSEAAADINGDGKVTAMDRLLLGRYLSGWDGYDTYFVTTETKTAEEFGLELAALIAEYGDRVDTGRLTKEQIQSGLTSGRVIVSTESGLPSLGDLWPADIVRDGGLFVLQFTDAADAIACADRLSGTDGVRYAEIDVPVTSDAVPSAVTAADGGTPLSWGVSATGADRYASRLVRKGVTDSVVAAVVDSGADASHSHLTGRVLSGTDFADGDGDPADGFGSGTFVSGILADCTLGLDVKILPVRVLDGAGRGYASQAAAGVLYAVENGADVVCLGFGGRHSAFLDDAVSDAAARGTVVVKSAGNDGGDTAPHCPAHIGTGITVAAADSGRDRASFSNGGDAVDIAAPGAGVVGCLPGERTAAWDGTSLAAAHVAAAAAMLLLENPVLTPAKVETVLKGKAADIGEEEWDPFTGAGFLTLTGEDSDYVAEEGRCGSALYWRLYENGLLEIYGSGAMYDYDNTELDLGRTDPFCPPWSPYDDDNTIWPSALILRGGVTHIGNNAFCFLDLEGTLTIPDSVETIGDSAFRWNDRLTGTLTIPDTVASIGDFAFEDTGFVGTLSLGKDLRSIGKGAFASCPGIEEVRVDGGNARFVLYDGVLYTRDLGCAVYCPAGRDGGAVGLHPVTREIADYAFDHCSLLRGELRLPGGLTEIGEKAFYGCTGLSGSLTIPSGVTVIGAGAFESCTGFGGSLKLPAGLTEIGAWVFCGCGFTGSLTIPDSVKTIGDCAFYGCGGFTGGLTIPAGVTEIGAWTFCGCGGFDGSLGIPAGVKRIGEGAFDSCGGFTGSLKLPAGLTEIGDWAFYGCGGFTGGLTIPADVTAIGKGAFCGCGGLTGKLTVPAGVNSVGFRAFDTGGLLTPYFYGSAPAAEDLLFGAGDVDITVCRLASASGWPEDGGLWNGYRTAVFEQ